LEDRIQCLKEWSAYVSSGDNALVVES